MFSSKWYRWVAGITLLSGFGMGILYWLLSFGLAIHGTVTWDEVFMFDTAVGGKYCLPIPYTLIYLRMWLTGGGLVVSTIGALMLLPALKYMERK